jgi:hypothetical protein
MMQTCAPSFQKNCTPLILPRHLHPPVQLNKPCYCGKTQCGLYVYLAHGNCPFSRRRRCWPDTTTPTIATATAVSAVASGSPTAAIAWSPLDQNLGPYADIKGTDPSRDGTEAACVGTSDWRDWKVSRGSCTRVPTRESFRNSLNLGAVASLLALTLGGCDLFEDSNPRPWIGYAYHQNNSRFEFELNDWKTERDCREAMLHIAATRPGTTTPVGCGYRGNNYWRVWIMNGLWGGSQLGCIRRMTSSVEAEGGMTYNLQLKGFPDRRGDDWYCV